MQLQNIIQSWKKSYFSYIRKDMQRHYSLKDISILYERKTTITKFKLDKSQNSYQVSHLKLLRDYCMILSNRHEHGRR